MHRLFLELPGGAPVKKSTEQYKAMLARVRPRDPAGKMRRRMAAGELARFPDRSHFASWTGTAPIDASSGEHTRHRLSRAGNRRLNHVLYMAGMVQLRNDTPGRACYRRKLQQSKTSMEAMRCLRRRLSDVACRQLVTDAAARTPATDQAGPGGHSGTTR